MTEIHWTCINCGREAAPNEPAREYGVQIVCERCYGRLMAANPNPSTIPEGAGSAIGPVGAYSPVREGLVPNAWIQMTIGTVVLLVVGLLVSAGPPAVAVLGGLAAMIAGLAFGVLLVILPYEIAKHRRHPNTSAIGLLCALTILVGVTWIVALVWSVMDIPERPKKPAGFGR